MYIENYGANLRLSAGGMKKFPSAVRNGLGESSSSTVTSIRLGSFWGLGLPPPGLGL
ncbi:hypothetical protein [Genomoviridae sp.]|nr:hypothetical protein [Genomoviridae sp.]